MTVIPLSKVDDRRLWRAGLVSLRELAVEGPVFGVAGSGGLSILGCTLPKDPVTRERRYSHEWGAAIEEDGERYRMCEKCQFVELHPYLMIGGVEVSRRPQGEMREPMPVAWPAPRRLVLEDMR